MTNTRRARTAFAKTLFFFKGGAWGAFLCFVFFPYGGWHSAYGQTSVRHLGTFNDWNAWSDGTGRNQVCYISTQPVRSEGKYQRRGPVFLIVAFSRQAPNGEVSYTSGYPYKKHENPALAVDDNEYDLGLTKGEVAFSLDPAQDPSIILAFRQGLEAIVDSVSWRGTETRDIFSLKGFSAAWREAIQACPR
ncbi:MAG: hypothetical protein GDA54_04710 [Alphaproteobacteria bacterium GM7ARS4]|nr:hypothetical protein [Alphaproteobacteria bacterium GM7ARS4]